MLLVTQSINKIPSPSKRKHEMRHEHQHKLRSAPRSVPSDNYRALRALLPNTKTNNHPTRNPNSHAND